MVVVNTQTKDIEIRHVMDIRSSEYIMVTAYKRHTHRTKCFLVNCQRGEIYSRDNNHWNRISDPFDYFEIYRTIQEALSDDRIPKFSTDSHGLGGILN